MITFRRHSPSGRKGEPRRGSARKVAPNWDTIIVSQLLALEPAQAANKNIYKQYAFIQLNNDFKEFYCLSDLWYKESRWDPKAKNAKSSSAYGIAQLLKTKSKDPFIQIDQGLKYIKHRHQTACNALAFHNRKGFY